jgi:choline dehydrogenase-like flavoprotein
MIEDSRSVSHGSELQTDLCIVGGGPAGLTIAREFIGRNLRVCLLESGAVDDDAQAQSLNQGTTVGDPYQNPVETRCRRLGGTAHSWVTLTRDGPGGRYVPLDAIDFEKRPFLPHSGWPFNKSHLDPYYARAHEVCGLGEYGYAAEDWVESANPLLPLKGSRVYTGIYHTGPSRRFTSIFPAEIRDSANVTICLRANVVAMETNDSGSRVEAARVACFGGTAFRVKARLFIIAAGGIENARLLLISNEKNPAGLGNDNDLVGRFFMEHPRMFCSDFVPSDPELFNRMGFYDIHPAKGTMIGGRLALSEQTLRQEQLLNLSVMFFPILKGERSSARKAISRIKKHLREGKVSIDTLRLARQAVTGSGELLGYGFRRFVRGDRSPVLDGWSRADNKPRRYGSFEAVLHLEQAPDPENRVTLGTELDALGCRRPQIHWRWTSIDEASAMRAREILAREIAQSGLAELNIDQPGALQGSVHHHMGTTRMHTDPRQGVVDENCCVHGVNNLFIAGSSVFPTGGYANPTLTIIALALRLADHLKSGVLS